MSTNVKQRPLLRVRQVARTLAVSERTVRRLIDTGQLPALKVGGQLRVDAGELETWIYSSPKPPATEAAHGVGRFRAGGLPDLARIRQQGEDTK